MEQQQVLSRAEVIRLAALSLGYDLESATRVIDASDAQRHIARANWQEAARSPIAKALERSDSVEIPSLAALETIVGQDNRGLVLSGVHMGDYLHALLKVLFTLQHRKVFICRKRQDTVEERLILERLAKLGVNASVVRTGTHHPLSLVSALKKGGVVLTFHDLSSRWGPAAQVRLFGGTGEIVKGPGTLAVLGEARLAPFATAQTNLGQVCTFDNILDCKQIGDKREAAEKVTRYLGRHLESAVRAAPEQWQHWPLLSEIACAGVAMPINRDDVRANRKAELGQRAFQRLGAKAENGVGNQLEANNQL